MTHQETVRAVARKLRQFTRRDISEMLDVLLEVWQEELLEPDGYVRLEGLGKFYVEQQTIPITGAVRQSVQRRDPTAPLPTTLNRYYFRFQPSDALYASLKAYREHLMEQDR